MHAQDPTPGRPPLTDLQKARLDYVRRDYESARAKNLAQLDAAGLVLLVEHLRGRLSDALTLIDELHDPAPPAHE
jgi:hypothetical protein